MMADELKHVRRHYAHFHRVLGSLLMRLVDEGYVCWVSQKQGHTLSPEGEDNHYSKAVYPLTTLEPYTGALSELTAVQADAMRLLGKGKPNASVALPVVLEGVRAIRLNRYTKWITEPLTKPQALGRMGRLVAHQRANLELFRRYQTLHDPRLDRVALHVNALEAAKVLIQASAEDTFRFRTAQLEVKAYTYLVDGGVSNTYVTDHGLLAVGPDVKLGFNTSLRKPRNDQVEALTLYEDDHVRVYEETAWQRAKARVGR